MANPWLKKNPFLSVWLSTANRAAGSLRGKAKRQVAAAISDAILPPASSAKPRHKR